MLIGERWHLGVSEFIFKENGRDKNQGENSVVLMCDAVILGLEKWHLLHTAMGTPACDAKCWLSGSQGGTACNSYIVSCLLLVPLHSDRQGGCYDYLIFLSTA